MRALVTGAKGFGGLYLVEYLLSKGYEVIATGRSITKRRVNDKFIWEPMDVLNSQQIKQTLNKYKPDEIYHLAAFAVTTGETSSLYYKTNFQGTLNLINCIAENVPNSKVLFVSSSGVYGSVSQESLPIQEHTPLSPNNHYAASKMAAEAVAATFASQGLQVYIARSFNHTGPRQPINYVCPWLVKQVAEISFKKIKPVIEVGNENVVRDFTDVRDVVRAYHLILQKGYSGQVYNVCGGKGYSILEIIKMLSKLEGIDLKIKSTKKLMRKQDASIIVGSFRKLMQHTGWKPLIPLEKTLANMLEYWKGRPGIYN